MLSPDFTDFWYSNYTGDIVNWNYTGSGYVNYEHPMFAALENGLASSLPLVAGYNRIENATVGRIYLTASSNVIKDLGAWGMVWTSQYTEWQEDWQHNEHPTSVWKAGTVQYLDYLMVVKEGAPNSAGNIIDIAEDLYSNYTTPSENITVANDAQAPYFAWGTATTAHVRGYTPFIQVGNTPTSNPTYAYEYTAFSIPYLESLRQAGSSSATLTLAQNAFYSQVKLDNYWLDYAVNNTGRSYTINSVGNYSSAYWINNATTTTTYSNALVKDSSDKINLYGNVTFTGDYTASLLSQKLNLNDSLGRKNIEAIEVINTKEADFRWQDPIYGWVGIYVKSNNDNLLTVDFANNRADIVMFNYSSPTLVSSGTSFTYNFTVYGHQGNASSMTDYDTVQTIYTKTYDVDFENYEAEEPAEDTYVLTNSIMAPENTTYASGNVDWNVTSSGNETGVTYQINAYLDGTPVGANQTSATGSFTGLSNGTYTFAVYGIGDNGASDYETVIFTVAIPSDTYTLSVSIVAPTNITYTSSTVNFEVSNTGNETGVAWQINAYLDGTPVGANQTSATGSFTGLGNGTYTFAVYGIGDNGASDYEEVIFTVYLGSPPPSVTVTISQPTATSYTTSQILVSLSASGGTIDTIWYNVKNGSAWVYVSNQTYTAPHFITGYVNGTYTFYAFANNTEGSTDSATVVFTVAIPSETPTVTNPTVTIVLPFNRTYITSTIPVELSTTGTVDAVWFNVKNGSAWIYTYNQTYTAATSLTAFVNGTYTFYAFAANSLGGSDEATVVFTVGIIANPALPQVNVDTLWLFLYEGDFLGFAQAILVRTFLSFEAAIAMIIMLFMVPIYLRTKSLLLLSILWILIGGFLVAAVPLASGVGILFIALAVGGLLWRLFRPSGYG
jgi:hypothetical protein